jgi:hypothetical protein
MGEKNRRYEFRETRLPKCACLNCGKVLDAATSMEGHAPHEGGVSICFDCGHVAIFDAQLMFRPPTDAEMLEIAGHPVLVQVQKARAEAMLMSKLSRKTIFRHHRSSLEDSMKTAIEVRSIDDLVLELQKRFTFWVIKPSDIHIEEYMPWADTRIGWEKTYLVTLSGKGVVGFTNGPLGDSNGPD